MDTEQYSRSQELQLRKSQQQNSWIQFPDSVSPTTQFPFIRTCRRHQDYCDCQRRECSHECLIDLHAIEDRNSGSRLKNQWSPLSETYTVTQWQGCCGKESSKYFSNTVVNEYQLGSVFMSTGNNNSCLFTWATSKWLGRKIMSDKSGKFCEETSTWKIPHLWLNQTYLGTQRATEADHHAVQAKANPFPDNHHHRCDGRETKTHMYFNRSPRI